MSNYVYLKSEPRLWTVGFYDPAGIGPSVIFAWIANARALVVDPWPIAPEGDNADV